MKSTTKIIYVDTRTAGNFYSGNDFVNHLMEEKDMTKEEASEYCGNHIEAFMEWVEAMARQDIECFFDDLFYSAVNQQRVIITGTLGLWDGDKEIQPVLYNHIDTAIKRCVGEYDYSVAFYRGALEVNVYHHDGVNRFRIKPLSKKGVAKCKNLYDGDYVGGLQNYHTRRFPSDGLF